MHFAYMREHLVRSFSVIGDLLYMVFHI
jgi:hypothetical protein